LQAPCLAYLLAYLHKQAKDWVQDVLLLYNKSKPFEQIDNVIGKKNAINLPKTCKEIEAELVSSSNTPASPFVNRVLFLFVFLKMD